MCPRKHIRKVSCQLFLTGFCPLGPECPRGQWVLFLPFISPLPTLYDSPKPNVPPAKAYDPPEPPSAKDLGPPPPGYGRYVDYERGGGGGGGGGPTAPNGQMNVPGGPRRNLDEVLCFKVRSCDCVKSWKFTNTSLSVVKRDTMPIIAEIVTYLATAEGMNALRDLGSDSGHFGS